MQVKAFDVYLRGGKSLLAERHAFGQLEELHLKVDGHVAWIWKGVLCMESCILFGQVGAESGEFLAGEGPIFGLSRVPIVGGHTELFESPEESEVHGIPAGWLFLNLYSPSLPVNQDATGHSQPQL